MYLGPYHAGRFGQTGYRPISSNLSNFDFYEHYPVQNRNSKSVYFMKKIDISYIQGPMGRAVLVKPMPAKRPNMGRSNFFLF